MARKASAGSGEPSVRLTVREEEVVRLAARGMSNKSIAHQLGISRRTVEGHLNHVFDKLGTSSRTELVHYALAHGLFVRPIERLDTAGLMATHVSPTAPSWDPAHEAPSLGSGEMGTDRLSSAHDPPDAA